MNYLYHRVPEVLEGNLLLPQNLFKKKLNAKIVILKKKGDFTILDKITKLPIVLKLI